MRTFDMSLRAAAVAAVSTIGVLATSPASAANSYWPPGTTNATSSINTNGTDTFLNAPAASGKIWFMAAGTGDPEVGAGYNGSIDSEGVLTVIGSLVSFGYTGTTGNSAIYGEGNGNAGVTGEEFYSGSDAYGVKGISHVGWPSAGVYGTSTATTGYPMGVIGIADTANGTGIYGEGASTGVQGYSLTTANGIGVSGVSGGSNGHAIDAVCNQSCTANGYAGYFHGNVWVTGSYGGSDIRLKKDIADSQYGLNEVMKMRPVTFRWKDGEDRVQVGLIAQEVQKLVPELVRAGDEGMLGINYSAIGPVLIKAIQEQQKMIQAQQAQIARLELDAHPGPRLLSWIPAGVGVVGLALAPLGLVVARRRRNEAN